MSPLGSGIWSWSRDRPDNVAVKGPESTLRAFRGGKWWVDTPGAQDAAQKLSGPLKRIQVFTWTRGDRELDISKLGKRVSTRRGGTEWLYECPRGCRGKRNKAPLELNIEKGVGHCFICGLSFKFKVNAQTKRDVLSILRRDVEDKPPGVGSIPFNLHRKFRERGVDPVNTIHRYRAGWDGSRICWPIYQGSQEMESYWRRAVYELQAPKVLTDPGSHGLLGGHLLRRHIYIVLTEGDWKAVSIPLPWIGLGLGGTSLSGRQLDLLGIHRPKEVVVCLDGGVDTRAISTKLNRAGIKNRRVVLPDNLGPDDIEMKERLNLLLEV